MSKAFIFVSLFLSLIIFSPGQARAQFETPENINISLSGLAVVNNNLISKIKIENPSQKTLNKVYISSTLTTSGGQSRQTVDGKVVTATESGLLVGYQDSEAFNLPPVSTQEKEIKLPFNQNIPSGTFYLNIQLKDQNTNLLRFISTQAFLNGTNRYLTINTSSCVLKIDGKTFSAYEGAIAKPNNSPVAECEVTNPSKELVTVRSKVDYAERFVVGFQKAIHEYSPKETISLNPGQTKTVSVVLPTIAQPQVYDGLFYLIDQNSQPISVMTDLRWTIEGPSARVAYVNLDQDYYAKGAQAKVEVKVFSSMDLYWRQSTNQGAGFSPQAGSDLKNPQLLVKIVSVGNQCGSQQIALPSTQKGVDWPVQKISVSINQDCPNPQVIAEVKEGDQILTKADKIYTSSDKETTILNKQTKLYYLIAGVVIVILVIGVYIWYQKRRQPPAPPTSPPPLPQPITTIAGLIIVIGLSILILKQFNLIQKLTDDFTVLAQFSGKTVRVTGYYNSTLTDNQGQPIGGSIEFDGVVSDFIQNGGQSQLSIPIDCSQPPKITVYGYTEASFACENAPSHLIYNYTLDGQPLYIANASSPDSTVVASGNELQLRAPRGRAYGPRTGTVNFQGTQLAYNTTHTLTASFYVLGGYTQSNKSNTGQIAVQFSCQEPCPNPGETNPHGTCDGKSCTQVNSCGVTTCGTNVDCGGCLPGEQQPHLACVNQSCQPVDACGTNTCATDQDCCPAGQITPHLACVNQSCQPVNTCGASTCATNNDCCPAGQTSPHQECDGTNCKTVDTCGPPIVCTKPGETAPHGECNGVACKQVNTCGVTSCTENKQCFSDDMCKCDGFNAINLKNPSSSQFEFEAFAKVENSDVSKAKVESIQFRMMKSSKSNPNTGTIIASSDLIKPELVSSTANKVRFRADWKVNPPSYDPNATYRVFSNIKCAPKAASSSASLNQALALAKGNLYSSETSQVLGESTQYSSEKLVQNNYLELDKLQDAYYTKIIETDACSAIRFEYGVY